MYLGEKSNLKLLSGGIVAINETLLRAMLGEFYFVQEKLYLVIGI